MSKNFEDLIRDADVSQFVKETGIVEEPKVIIHQPVAITPEQPDPNAPVRDLKTKFGGLKSPMIGAERDARRELIMARGDYVELLTQDQHEKDITKVESQQESDMWQGIVSKFGDAINFEGSPFLIAGKTDQQILDSVAKAEEYVELFKPVDNSKETEPSTVEEEVKKEVEIEIGVVK